MLQPTLILGLAALRVERLSQSFLKRLGQSLYSPNRFCPQGRVAWVHYGRPEQPQAVIFCAGRDEFFQRWSSRFFVG